MNEIPVYKSLPIQYLAASFDNVTNSYKYYWFLAILAHVRHHNTRIIPVDRLVANMVADVWYPAYYFRLSFGKQDRLGNIAMQAGDEYALPMDASHVDVVHAILGQQKPKATISREIKSLQQYVPYRFLRPFFSNKLHGMKDSVINAAIEKMAGEAYNDRDTPCLYRFTSNPDFSIEIHPDWFEYLKLHLSVLTGFCLWQLTGYIQKNNPNVSNIPGKILEPVQRDLKRAREFWGIVMNKLGDTSCIYSGETILLKEASLDHFLPWRFVAHDLLWNIVPTSKRINSSKSDNLPDMEQYFGAFSSLQYRAVQVVAASNKPALLEDHILLVKSRSVHDLVSMPLDTFRSILYDTVAPQTQIAANMGFPSSWRHR